MRLSVINILELVIGAILLGAGLLYLTSQYRAVDHLSDIVNEKVLGNDEIYQQYQYIEISQVPDEQLYAFIMGYREYPIMIDGVTMSVDETDFERYLSLVKEGIYKKSYKCDSNNNIEKILFTYSGL